MKHFIANILFVVFLCGGSSAIAARIDVLVLYDTKAKTWVDNNGGIDAFAGLAIEKMNMATANSGIDDLTFNLVHAEEISYTSSSNGTASLSKDLTALRAGTDGLDGVNILRLLYGADLVTLLVDTEKDYGYVGAGYTLNSFSGNANFGYNVCAIQSVANSHTLTHEVGHNLGAGHSRDQKKQTGPSSISDYAAGMYFTGTDGTPYHTIMAYTDDGYGNRYADAPLFSTPLQEYQGVFAGNAVTEDNARVIRETMASVQDYRIGDNRPSDLAVNAQEVGAQRVKINGSGVTQITNDPIESVGYVGYLDKLVSNYQYRGYALFNLSSIPRNAVISSIKAQLSTAGATDNPTHFNAFVVYPSESNNAWEAKNGDERYAALTGQSMFGSDLSSLISSVGPLSIDNLSISKINSISTQGHNLRIAIKEHDEINHTSSLLNDSTRFKLTSFGLDFKYAVPPSLLIPANNNMVKDVNPILQWDNALDSTTSNLNYIIEVSKDRNFNDIIYNSGDIYHNIVSDTIPGSLFVNNNTYYWRVSVKNPLTLWHSYSQTASFVYAPDNLSDSLVTDVLAYAGHSFEETQGNGDGIVTAGETGVLKVRLLNQSNEILQDVKNVNLSLPYGGAIDIDWFNSIKYRRYSSRRG